MGKCLQCSRSTTNPKFCSRSCSATYNNSLRVKIARGYKVKCKNCKTVIYRIPGSHCVVVKRGEVVSNHFCNNSCQAEYSIKLSQKRVRATKEANTSADARRYLLQKHGHKCAICGRTTWNKEPIPLELDHKNGDSTNGKISNLRLICPNCHAQTPTYKGRNKGNGRHYRRQRYKEGKSY